MFVQHKLFLKFGNIHILIVFVSFIVYSSFMCLMLRIMSVCLMYIIILYFQMDDGQRWKLAFSYIKDTKWIALNIVHGALPYKIQSKFNSIIFVSIPFIFVSSN